MPDYDTCAACGEAFLDLECSNCLANLLTAERDARLLSAGEALAGAAKRVDNLLWFYGKSDPFGLREALSVWHETVKAVGEGTENEEENADGN